MNFRFVAFSNCICQIKFSNSTQFKGCYQVSKWYKGKSYRPDAFFTCLNYLLAFIFFKFLLKVSQFFYNYAALVFSPFRWHQNVSVHFQYRWTQLTVANGFFKDVRNQLTKFFVLQDFVILKITRCYMQSNSVESGRMLFGYITFEQVLFKFARFLLKLSRSGHILSSPTHS